MTVDDQINGMRVDHVAEQRIAKHPVLQFGLVAEVETVGE